MIIAVNTRFLLSGYMEGYGNYTKELFARITSNNPGHQFIFIYDRKPEMQHTWSSNVIHVTIGPAARHPLLWTWWYDYRLPIMLKKYKADVFISPDGFCSLRTKVPQLLVVHDLAFLHNPGGISSSQLSFYKRKTGRFLKKAKLVVTVSAFSRKDILVNYKIDDSKIHIVPNGVKEIFNLIDDGQKAKTKEQYTEGKEYFLYAGSIHPRKNLVNLLKAFSLFKKRQQSGMKLVLAGRLAWNNEKFLDDLKSYKYRDDVILTGFISDEQLANIIGSAYAMVYPSLYEGFGVPVLEAMRSGVPVITSLNSAMQEIGKDAALYVDPNQPTSIAEKMMLIYKDEKLRKELITKGIIIQSEFTWDKSANIMWQMILLAAR